MTPQCAVMAGFLIALGPAALTAQVAPAARRPPTIVPRGFIGFGVTQFLAVDTFEAVFGDATGRTWQAGGQLLVGRGLFFEVGVERFQRMGQRVFVFDGAVIPLGVADTVTITPVTVIGGLRFRTRSRLRPYVGGGVGTYGLRETSAFAEAADNVKTRHAGYVFVMGSEFQILRLLGVAGEWQLATVPGALGENGVSRDYAETNLGGQTVRIKLIVGR